MVYRILSCGLGWCVAPIIIYRLFHVLVQKLHLVLELVHRLRNVLRFYEVGGNMGV